MPDTLSEAAYGRMLQLQLCGSLSQTVRQGSAHDDVTASDDYVAQHSPVDNTSVPICWGQRAHDSFRRPRWRQRLLAEREQPARCDSLVDDLIQAHGGPAMGALRSWRSSR
jgi:hypothetical protein